MLAWTGSRGVLAEVQFAEGGSATSFNTSPRIHGNSCPASRFVVMKNHSREKTVSIVPALQAHGTAVMAVGSIARVPVWQVHLGHDLVDDARVPENTGVGEKRELPGLGVVHDTTTRQLLIFNVTRHAAVPLKECPSLQMAPRMG